MISARDRVVQYESGKALKVQGVTVNQNDYVIADRCGSVFIPAERIEEVLELGECIDRRQNSMLEAVRSGQSVAEVMHDSQFQTIAVKSNRNSNGTP